MLQMQDCVLAGNSVGLDIGPAALALLRRCALRFNGSALAADGCVSLWACQLWGNGKVRTLLISPRVSLSH